MPNYGVEPKRYYGIYRGVVVNNNDPLGHRRLKLTIPQVLGSQVTDWCWGVDGAATKVSPPVVGQGVLVSFEGGDPSFPIWLGTSGVNKSSSKDIYIGQSNSTTLVSKTLSDGSTALDLVASIELAISGAGVKNLDGGVADSVYGGTTPIDGGGV
jgi:Type VI secretion system/phage-baseplate injector OB domain